MGRNLATKYFKMSNPSPYDQQPSPSPTGLKSIPEQSEMKIEPMTTLNKTC